MNQGVRFILAVVAMIAVVLLTNIIFPPVPRTASKVAADSAAKPVDTAAAGTTTARTTPRPQVPAPVTPATPTAPERVVIVESPLYRFGFSTRGAALVSAEMLRFQSFTRDGEVQLAGRTPGGLVNHSFRINDQITDLNQLTFTPSATLVELNDSSAPTVLRFTSNTPQFGTVTIDYTLRPDNYLIDVRVTGTGTVHGMYVNVGPTLAINEVRRAEDERALAYVVNSPERGIESLPLRKLNGPRTEVGPLDWVALKNKYFVAAVVVDTAANARQFGGLKVQDVPAARYAANLSATLLPNEQRAFAYRLYLGPQEYDRLVAVGERLQDVNPMGWRVFRPILRPLAEAITWALVTMHRAFNMSYGWVLILFGILIRLAMWPLNAKTMRSQMKNMEFQPRIKEIQTKYQRDPVKMREEMVKLQKEGFNPMGGCLPMLVPMPVLITLFFVFQSTIEFRGVSFLWLPDLSRADPLYILPVILGATIFVQQLISMKTMPPNPQMKVMLYFMPLFMVMIFFNLASGLNLYYAAQNLPGFIQQMQLTKERVRYQKERGLLPATPAPAPAAQPAAPRKPTSRRKR